MAMAVVIDGAFFLRRFSYSFPDHDVSNPQDVARCLLAMVNWHLTFRQSARDPDRPWYRPGDARDVYRIFFYDCPPLTKRLHHPVSKRSLDLRKTPTAIARIAIHEQLLRVRKVALRLGRLNDQVGWRLKPESLSRWLAQQDTFTPQDNDFELDTTQKGVDMRLGLDVATMALKQQVDQIILVAGDGDFVPAAKLARREGIDVVLDTMGGTIATDLIDHADGRRACRKPAPLYAAEAE